jgi:hypothetical protein
MTASTLQLDVGCPVVIAAAIPEPVYDGLTCPKYVLWDSNPSSWLAKEQKSRLCFGVRQLLLLYDEA